MKTTWTERGSRLSGQTREGKQTRTVEYTAPGIIAKNYKSASALEIEAGWNFSGSGPGSFGGASHWPVAKLHVSFQIDEEEKRNAFVEALKVFTANYFNETKT